MLQTLDFSGKTALVMGASRGIGLATARVLAQYGADVALAGRKLDTITAATNALRSQGYTAKAIICDVAHYDSVVSGVTETLGMNGQIDIVVNNAGLIEPLDYLVDSDPKLWGLAADVNYKGVYHTMRAVLPHMLSRKTGVIVNMSSGAANSALVGWSHYCSGKAAAKKLTEVAHKEVGDKGIRIVGLSPGTVATSMMEKIRDSKINVVSDLDWNKHIPAAWAGEGVAFLCGPEGQEFAGTDFSIKTAAGRLRVGLPAMNAPDD